MANYQIDRRCNLFERIKLVLCFEKKHVPYDKDFDFAPEVKGLLLFYIQYLVI